MERQTEKGPEGRKRTRIESFSFVLQGEKSNNSKICPKLRGQVVSGDEKRTTRWAVRLLMSARVRWRCWARGRHLRAELLGGHGREQRRRDVEDGATARLACAGHAPAGAGAGDEHAAGELRVGIELQRVLDHVGVLAGGTRGASADDRAAVGNAGVIAVELFLRNEGDRGVKSAK